jgi:hypothetical protein
MATTTNYGWTTPDNTALVKDGASAIRTLGSSVDTTVKALSPGTTAGDVDYYTSSTAKARLGIGTTGQLLTVSGGVPAWTTVSTGGMTLISTTTLSGATVTLSSIPQTYNSLFMVITGVTNATADGKFRCAPNGTTNISNQVGSDATTLGSNVDDYMLFTVGDYPLRTSALNSWTAEINNYASTTSFKPYFIKGGFFTTTEKPMFNYGYIASNTAVTSLVFSNGGGNLSTGTVLLYGVK